MKLSRFDDSRGAYARSKLCLARYSRYLAEKYKEALGQLAKYRADKSVPALARGTTLHQIVFQFKGSELVRLEQIAEEPMP